MGNAFGAYHRLSPQDEMLVCDLGSDTPSARSPMAPKSSKMSKILRYSIMTAVVLGIAYIYTFGFDILVDLAPGMSSRESVKDVGGTVGLYFPGEERAFVGDLEKNEHCVQDGSMCICADFKRCQQWTFQVGDVLIFEPAYGYTRVLMWLSTAISALISHSDAVHCAAVAEVHSQTPEGIILVESLKPPMGIVQKINLRIAIHRWPYFGFWIRRPDPTRFPINQPAITEWSSSVLGQPYDKMMVIPFFRRWMTHGRYIKENPDYAEKQRALELYKNGGPGMWICTQLIAWLLAFPGGINTLDSWPIMKMQDFPGDVLRLPIWDAQNFHIHCGNQGCWLGRPA